MEETLANNKIKDTNPEIQTQKTVPLTLNKKIKYTHDVLLNWMEKNGS